MEAKRQQEDLSGRVKDVKKLIQELDDGIISTFSAQRIGDQAEAIEDEYNIFAENHVQVTDTSDYESKLIETLSDNSEPTKGFIYGPYGHGKTSIMVKLWRDLEEDNIVAVPPFTFSSFTDLRDSLYGWLHYKLSKEASEDKVKELEEIHSKYISDAIEDVLEDRFDNVERTRMEEFKEMFKEVSDSQDLNLEISPNELIDFFDECTQLAKDAGYDGLVILPDELQQYLDNTGSRNTAIKRLRDMVWDLLGNHISDDFGIIFSMPTRTKSQLDSQASDLINRLQKDGLDLNLETVYGKDFSKKLWNKYSEKFDFEDKKYEIISERCFESIGQITTRNDLSDGPRTVIDIFRIAINHYIEEGTTFTSLDLGEAYHTGEVRYSGDNDKIRTAIENTIQNSNVDSNEKEKVIKLCAVFPQEGLDEEIKEAYDISETLDVLSSKLHGELMTRVTNGYTLVDVTPENRTTDIQQETVKDFIDQFDENSHFARKQCQSFSEHILSEDLLDSKKGSQRGWKIESGNGNFENFKGNSFSAIFNGTFNKNYPDRNLYVKVTDSEKEGKDFDTSEHNYSDQVDLKINFVLDWQGETQSKIIKDKSNQYLIYLDTTNHQEEIPGALNSLSESVRPKDLSPFLMLALIDYIDGVKENEDGHDENQLEGLQGRIRNVIKRALMVQENIVENSDLSFERQGDRLLEGVFNQVMSDTYPNYHTVKKNKKFRKFIEDYKKLLNNLDLPAQRKGDEWIEGTAQEIAEKFGRGGTSGFESKLDETYRDFIEKENYSKNSTKIRTKLHPFEERILSEIDRENGEVSVENIYTNGENLGYREDEIKLLLEVLIERGMAEKKEKNGKVFVKRPKFDRSITDLENKYEEAENKLEILEELDSDELSHIDYDIQDELDEIAEEINSLDQSEKEKIQNLFTARLSPLVSKLEGEIKKLHHSYLSECKNKNQELNQLGKNLVTRDLENEIKGQVGFVKNLNQARRMLKTDFQDLSMDIDEAQEDFSQRISELHEENAENTRKLQELGEEIERAKEDFEEQKNELNDSLQELKEWKSFTGRVGNLYDNIMTHSETFDDELDSKDKIEEFERDVKEKFADDIEGGLENLESFRQRLDDIEETFSKSRKSKKEEFNNSKEQLNDLLNRIVKKGGKRLRDNINLDHPEKSRKQLIESFRTQIEKNVFTQLKEDLDQSSNDLGIADLKGVDVATEEIEKTESEIVEAREELESCRNKVQNFGYYDIGDDEKENDLETNINDLWEKIKSDEGISRRTREFLQPQEVSDSQLNGIMEGLEPGSTRDLKELLLENSEDEQVEVDEFLDRVKELFQKNQVDIKVETRRRR